MKIILELPELEAIVKENISSKYPNQDAAVSIQNKRNGVEVTVVLTEKLAEKECETTAEELVARGYCVTKQEEPEINN